jgi:carbamoyl-phosphate synthase large subunit
VGRRIELVEAFREAAADLRLRLTIHGADINWYAPAAHWVDHALLQLVERERIDLIIPLIDSDLLALSRAKPRFAERGCHVLISSEPVIRVCRDKLLTFQALRSAGIDTPDTWAWADVVARKRPRFPLFLKPREGSAGKGLHSASNAVELRVIIEVGRRVIGAIGSCEGVITVQCMVTAERRIRVIEVNPRFGGGAPLSIHAGANFPKWLLTEFLGRPLRDNLMSYRDAVTMLRYDQSVFLNGVKRLKRITNRKNPLPRNRSRHPRA